MGMMAKDNIVRIGGGTSSLSSDPLGKSYAQILLDFPVEIPADMAISRGWLDA